MEALKQQLLEVEEQRDQHGATIGKLRQVHAPVLGGPTLSTTVSPWTPTVHT